MRSSFDMDSEVVDLIDSFCARAGLSRDEVVSRAFGLAFVPIPLHVADRLREVEEAADLKRGSIAESLLVGVVDQMNAGPGEVFGYIASGWNLKDAALSAERCALLQARWREEDAAGR